MVCFTCSFCGDSLKKASVSKHYQTKCRKKDPLLTCVDCLKDFKGNEYEAHTKCLTEEEKYSAKGFVPKPSQNKGERKQQAWQECMQTVLKKPTLKPDEKDLIRAVSKYENVPRKKAKFINFLTHAFKQYANKNDLIDRVWIEMETVFKEMSASSQEQQQNSQPQQQPQSKPQLAKQQQQPKQPQQSKQQQTKQQLQPKQQQQQPAKQTQVKQQQAKQPQPPQGKQQQQQQQQVKQQKQVKQDVKNPAKTSAKPDDNVAKKENKRKRQAETDEKPGAKESGKSDDKQKKKKQKTVEEKTVEGNIDIFVNDDMECIKEKKHRKRKADENCQTEQNDSVTDEGEPGKKKKKKKNDKPVENQVNEAPQQKAEDDAKKKKAKKPKTPNAAEPKANVETVKTGAGDSSAVKKEKKAKKSENKENLEQKPPAKKVKNEQQGEGEKAAPQKKKGRTEATVEVNQSSKPDQFDWKATILQVLNEDGKNSRIQLQKLQKRVLKLHCQILNCENSDKKEKKFLKKLKEMQEIEIDKDFVVLKS